MKTTFTTEDRSHLDTVAEAIKRENYLSEIKEIDAMLPRAVDSGCEFANGGGYVQHTKKAIDDWSNAVRALLKEYEGNEMADMWRQNPRGIIGRYLDDGNSPDYRCTMRITSIDSDFREWGQPYYAMNPGRGTMKPWLDVTL